MWVTGIRGLRGRLLRMRFVIGSGLGALVFGSLLKMSLICLGVISICGSCSGCILSKVVSTMFSISSSESAVAR